MRDVLTPLYLVNRRFDPYVTLTVRIHSWLFFFSNGLDDIENHCHSAQLNRNDMLMTDVLIHLYTYYVWLNIYYADARTPCVHRSETLSSIQSLKTIRKNCRTLCCYSCCGQRLDRRLLRISQSRNITISPRILL